MGKSEKEVHVGGGAVALIPANTTNKKENTMLPECRKLDNDQRTVLRGRYEDIFRRVLTDEEFRDIDTIAVITNGRALVSDEYEPGPGKWQTVKVKKTRRSKEGDYVTEAFINRFCMNTLEDMRLRRDYPEVFAEFRSAVANRAEEGLINWLMSAANYYNKRDIEEESLKDVSDSVKAIVPNLEALHKMRRRSAADAPGDVIEDPLVLTETIIRELKCDPALLREFSKELTSK